VGGRAGPESWPNAPTALTRTFGIKASAMARDLPTANGWRWLLAAAAAVVAFFGTVYFSLFVLFFGPYPKDMAEPTAAFLMASVLVLSGSLVAPRHRSATAIMLSFVGAFLGTSLGHHLVGAVLGGLAAVSFIVWWFNPRRTKRSTVWIMVASCAVLSGFLVVVYARYVDGPAQPDPLPYQLTNVLGTESARISAFYEYDLGGFIDHEWLWRINAEPDAIAILVGSLGLQPTSDVPPRFWQMPPRYWPRSMPVDAQAFQTAEFHADNRGPDGPHYFLLHDRGRQTAFVWFKNNF
jgi:hypothetical protein